MPLWHSNALVADFGYSRDNLFIEACQHVTVWEPNF